MKKLKVLFLMCMIVCIYTISISVSNSSYNLTILEKPVDTVLSTSNATYDDPLIGMEWGLYTVGADIAHSMDVDGTNSSNASHPIVVAIIDTGVDLDHEDLKANILNNTGWDFVDPGTPPDDENGHGTHCAGIVAAIANNSVGVSGIAPGAKIIPFRVLDEDGSGHVYDVTKAINWIVANYSPKNNQTHGVDIISMSLGASSLSDDLYPGALEDAINAAVAEDIIVLAATGNENGEVLYPARLPNVLGIAAISVLQEKASYSNYGSQVDFAAPGGDWHFFGMVFVGILSTWRNDGYAYAAGTSMATPMAAGVVALLLGNGTNPADIINELNSTSRIKDLGAPGRDDYYGNGLVRIVANNWDYNSWYHKYYDAQILQAFLIMFGEYLIPKPQVNWVYWVIIGGVVVFFAIIAIYEMTARK